MEIESHIKLAIGLIKSVMDRTKSKGFLLGRSIYLRPEIYQNLLSKNPDPRNIGILIHENTHYSRMNKIGIFKFNIIYLFSRKSRLEEELVAYKEQMKYLKSKGLNYDLDRVAKNLSNWVYLWCTSYTQAKFKLQKIWDEI